MYSFNSHLLNPYSSSLADLDYAGEYGRTQITFSTESNRECFTIQTYHDELDEADETFLIRSRSASGLGQLSPNPLIAEVLITNIQSKG